MKFQSHYPIGQFVVCLLERSGLSLDDFVRRLGYQNSFNGKTEFLFLLNHGLCELKFRDGLASFVPDKVSLQLAWHRTDEIRHQENEKELIRLERHDRRRFRPHLLALYSFVGPRPRRSTKREKTSLIVELPRDIATARVARQLRLVKEAIRKHYAEHSSVTSFGEQLSAYVLFLEYEAEGQYFSVEGEPAESADDDKLDEQEIALDPFTLARIDRGDFDDF